MFLPEMEVHSALRSRNLVCFLGLLMLNLIKNEAFNVKRQDPNAQFNINENLVPMVSLFYVH